MLQNMDNKEASCIFYVKVRTFTQLEQSKTSLLTVNETGIVRLTIQHDLIVSVSFMYYPGDCLDKHQQTLFPSNNVLILSDNQLISAVIHCNLSQLTNKHHRTD